MKYSYKVNIVNQIEGFVGVVYSTPDEHTSDVFIRVPLKESKTEMEKTIKQYAPLARWTREIEIVESANSAEDFLDIAGEANTEEELFSGGILTTPDDIESFLSRQKNAFKQQTTMFVNEAISDKYSDIEIQSFSTQVWEAKTYKKDPEADISLIKELATKQGITVSEMADEVITKANELDTHIADAIVTHRALLREILTEEEKWRSGSLTDESFVTFLESLPADISISG